MELWTSNTTNSLGNNIILTVTDSGCLTLHYAHENDDFIWRQCSTTDTYSPTASVMNTDVSTTSDDSQKVNKNQDNNAVIKLWWLWLLIILILVIFIAGFCLGKYYFMDDRNQIWSRPPAQLESNVNDHEDNNKYETDQIDKWKMETEMGEGNYHVTVFGDEEIMFETNDNTNDNAEIVFLE
eukprot:UN11732